MNIWGIPAALTATFEIRSIRVFCNLQIVRQHWQSQIVVPQKALRIKFYNYRSVEAERYLDASLSITQTTFYVMWIL